jgi:hypothetical protein
VSFTDEELDRSREDYNHRTENGWLPGDVWRLDRIGGEQAAACL